MAPDAPDPAFDRLRREIREDVQALVAGVETRLGQRMEDLGARLGQRIEDVDARLGQRIEDVDARLDAVDVGLRRDVAAVNAGLRQHVDAVESRVRRHFDVVAEDLVSKVQLVGEGLGALDEKVERFCDDVRDEFAKVDRRFLHLEARVISALERR
ncbi:MAG TPA: hypothetical protein VGV13_03520 [Methylomirabilota bacterium]|jgi:hypothetical protein|nr:hypothetical protein [Methylomirabilota bacterium]